MLLARDYGVLRIRDRIKFDSWSSISGMSKDDAKLAYIDLVKNLSFENEEISCDEREELDSMLNNTSPFRFKSISGYEFCKYCPEIIVTALKPAYDAVM